MDNLFHRLVSKHTPQANPHVMNGLAETYMQHAEAYIDSVFQSASRSFPAGLEYVGFARCTETEEYNEITRLKNNKRTFDLARSNLFLVKYHFKFEGKELPPRYIYLPFVEPGGIIYLGGSCFHLSPVLTDKVISPGMNSIFVRLLRDKVNFERCYHSFVLNGVNETVQIVWSRIYRRSTEIKKMPVTTKANTSIVHYLLAKFGFHEMFERFCGFRPIIGGEELDEKSYPASDWMICESSQIKPKTFVGDFYNPCRIRIVVPKHCWNSFTQSLVAGFFYVADHFPDAVKPAFVDSKSQWMVLLGNIIFSGVYGAGKLHDDIQEHFYSLDEYVDGLVIKKLEEIGHSINDFYDLMALILRHFDSWVINAADNMISLYGKTMEVLYYVLYDITSAIFRTNFRLNKLATKKKLTDKEIVEVMNKQLKMGVIYGLTRANIAVSSVSYSGDNKYPKITSVVAMQQSISGATRGRRARVVVDSSKRIHTSMVEAGSLLFLSKSNPTPAVRANMYLNMDLATGTIMPKPKFEEIRQKTERMLKGIIPEST